MFVLRVVFEDGLEEHPYETHLFFGPILTHTVHVSLFKLPLLCQMLREPHWHRLHGHRLGGGHVVLSHAFAAVMLGSRRCERVCYLCLMWHRPWLCGLRRGARVKRLHVLCYRYSCLETGKNNLQTPKRDTVQSPYCCQAA